MALTLIGSAVVTYSTTSKQYRATFDRIVASALLAVEGQAVASTIPGVLRELADALEERKAEKAE